MDKKASTLSKWDVFDNVPCIEMFFFYLFWFTHDEWLLSHACLTLKQHTKTESTASDEVENCTLMLLKDNLVLK